MQSKFLLTLFSALLLSNGVLGSLRPRGFQGQGFHHGGGRNGNGFGGTKTTTTIAAAKTSTTTTSSSSTQTATNNANNNGGNSNPQTSFTLLQSVIQSNSNIDGTETGVNGSTTAGIVASAKSPNNFINFCATSSKPLMNGVQIRTGACNPIPMGEIGNFDTAPQTKIAFPTNNGNIAANTNFTVLINMKNFAVGTFTNADSTYYTAPCQLDSSGTPIGHTHIVIQAISSLDSTTPLAPNKFAFFLGLKGGINGNGQVTGAVPGLPAGTYRLSTINTCGNHQALNGAIAQRGSFDDQVYFTVGGSGTGSGSTSTTTTNNGGTGTTNNGGKGTTNNGGTGTTNNGGKGTTNNGGTGTTNNGGKGTTNNGGNGKQHGKVKRDSLLAKRRIHIDGIEAY